MHQDEIIKKSIAKKPKRKLWLVILIAVIIAILLGLIGWLTYAWRMNVKKLNEFKNASSSSSTTSTSTSPTAAKATTPTASSTSSSASDEANITACKTTAENFMAARKNRDYDEVKSYVTSAFLSKYNQLAFTGASSPGIGSYSIDNPTTKETGKKYDVTVSVKWQVGGEPSGDNTWILNMVKENDKCLVNDYDAPM